MAKKEPVKVVYIASPFSHSLLKVMKLRRKRIAQVAAKLHLQFPHAFILPITQSACMKDWEPTLGESFKYWKDRDLKFISRSDEVWVVMMDGWEESVGVQAEIKYATRNNIPVSYINPDSLVFMITEHMLDQLSKGPIREDK